MSEVLVPMWKTLGFWLTAASWLAVIVSTTATAIVQNEVFGAGSIEMKWVMVAISVATFVNAALANLGYGVSRASHAKTIEALKGGGKTLLLLAGMALLSGCDAATPFGDHGTTMAGFCTCEGCGCECQPGGFGPCHCTLESCDCPCDHIICDGESCRIVPGKGTPASLETLPAEQGFDQGQPQALECPDPRLSGDVPAELREWYRNLSNPGSCVQCSIGMCGVDQGVSEASTLLWDTRFGKAEHHGSYPSRVAEYARARGMRIYNVTGAYTYDWMKWACRNGRPVAIGCSTAHFQTLFGHDPQTNEWFVCNNNSPQKIDTYTDAQFRRLHEASGQWCVILDYPPSPARANYAAWWELN